LIGVEFNCKDRNIVRFEYEKVERAIFPGHPR
jgi:hypothetical protein